MNTVAIIQARMSSTRLPRKVMADVEGRPLLQRVVERARKTHAIDLVVVATTNQSTDDDLVKFCEENEIPFCRGSEEDVLDRFYQTAKSFNADVVVRVTADCPLLDPRVVDNVVQTYQEGGFDYVSNVNPPTFPDGLDTEAFSFQTLERAWGEAKLKSEREHVTPYIWKQPNLFKLKNVLNERDLSKMRWTVDEPQDLEFIRAVYHYFGDTFFGMNEIVNLLNEHPDLTDLNTGFARNEGYQKSLQDDLHNK